MRKNISQKLAYRILVFFLFSLALLSNRVFAQALALDKNTLKQQIKDQIVEKLFNNITSAVEGEVRNLTYFDQLLNDYNFLAVNLGKIKFSEKALEIYRNYQEARKKDQEAKGEEPRNNVRNLLMGEFSQLLLSALDQPSQEMIGELQGLYGEAKDRLKKILDVTQELDEDPKAEVMELFKKYGLSGALIDEAESLEINVRRALDKYKDVGDYYEMFQTLYQGLSSKSPGDKLDALFQLGSKFGGKIPILGKFIELYSQVALEMISAVGRLGTVLRARQGYCLGVGTTGHIPSKYVDERNQIFSTTFADIDQVCPYEKIGIYRDIYYDLSAENRLYFWTGSGFVVGNPNHMGINDVKEMMTWLREHGYSNEAQDIQFISRAYNIPPGFIIRKKRVKEMSEDIQKRVRLLSNSLNLCSAEDRQKFLLTQGGLQAIIEALGQDSGAIEYFPYVDDVVNKIIEDRIIKNTADFWATCERVKNKLENLVVVSIEGEVVDQSGKGVSGLDISINPSSKVLENCSRLRTEAGQFRIILYKEKDESFDIILQAKDEKRSSEEKMITLEGDKALYKCTLKIEKAELKSLLISPEEKTIKVGETVIFKINAEYEDGSVETIPLALVSFSGAPNGIFKATEAGTFTVIAAYLDRSAKATMTVEPQKPECPENEVWNPEKQECECKEGFVRNKENKCLSLNDVIKEVSKDEDEDICSKSNMKEKYASVNELVQELKSLYSRFQSFSHKFNKEINDRAADICKNGIAAYCYYSSEKTAADIENVLSQIKDLSTEIIMLFGICPDLAKEMQAEGYSLKSLISTISGIGSYNSDAQNILGQMQKRLNEFGCDENEVRQLGQQVVPPGTDPDFLQDGGNQTEVSGDGVDNDADGLQDESVEGLAGFNITVVLYDSGNLKDDIFGLSVSGYGNLGTTPAGGLRSFGLNLPAGTYTATVTVISAPDNIGTFTVVVAENGKTIASSSGQPPQGASVTLTFTVSRNK